MYIVSVVRDFDFYNKCVRNNRFNSGAKFVVYDNTVENIGIPKRYNDFLDNYDENDEQWICFCHEDWQAKEEYISKLSTLNKKCIYGTLGTDLKKRLFMAPIKRYIGQIHVSNKDGTCAGILGKPVPTGTNVDTFDCMAIFIHSSLIKKYHIRFDENLDWHHYAEELCIRLREEHGIRSKIFQIKCKHWSYGVSMPNQGFLDAFNYVKNKFKKTQHIYTNTTIDEVIGKNFAKGVLRSYGEPYTALSFPSNKLPLFQHVISHNSKHHAYYIFGLQFIKIHPDKVKICLFGIPLLSIGTKGKNEIKLFALIPIFIKRKARK